MFWNDAERVTREALAAGKLLPISTEAEVLLEGDVSYLGHIATNNASKKMTTIKSPSNPFLPYESSLYVGEAGAHHVCLLNKFPVLSPHLLICTKEFVPQKTVLTQEDFSAWLLGVNGNDVLGFYNSGPVAGASQPHRHMQLVKTEIPLEPVITSGMLPFKHCLFSFSEPDPTYLYQCYQKALDSLSLRGEEECQPYNILLTARWMLVVPRSTNNIDGVFANGLNYSGRFLVKKTEQLEWLKQYGVMHFLSACSVA